MIRHHAARCGVYALLLGAATILRSGSAEETLDLYQLEPTPPFDSISALASTPEGHVIVVDTDAGRVAGYDGDGTTSREWLLDGDALPVDVSINDREELAIAEYAHGGIRVFGAHDETIRVLELGYPPREVGLGNDRSVVVRAKPGEDRLVARVTSSGARHAFGGLRRGATGTPAAIDALNRIRLSFCSDSVLVVAKMSVPEVHLYSLDGRSRGDFPVLVDEVWEWHRCWLGAQERHLRSAGYDVREALSLDELERQTEALSNGDGHPHGAAYLLDVACLDGSIFLLLPGAALYEFSVGGEVLGMWRLMFGGERATVDLVALGPQGQVFAADMVREPRVFVGQLPPRVPIRRHPQSTREQSLESPSHHPHRACAVHVRGCRHGPARWARRRSTDRCRGKGLDPDQP